MLNALETIPKPLLGRLWPECRVIMGLRVCKGLRSDLAAAGTDVLLLPKHPPHSADEVETTLRSFVSCRIKLAGSPFYADGGHDSLLSAFLSAANHGAERAIVHLDLQDLRIEWTHSERTTETLRQLVEKLVGLHHLEISGCARFNVIAALAPANQFRKLVHLGLNRLKLGDGDVKKLADLLRSWNTLEHLGLGHNDVGMDGMGALCPVLCAHTRLAHLNLAWDAMGQAGAEALVCTLRACRQLKDLNLYHVEMGAAGAAKLAGVLPECCKLEWLDLSLNGISGPEALRMAESMQALTALTRLSLSGNKFGDDAAAALATSLSNARKLTYLNLRQTAIGEAGVCSLTPMLQSCSQLQWLDLTWNQAMGDGGAAALAAGLKGSTSLMHLDAAWCGMSQAGAAALVEVLVSLPSLEVVDLQMNLIPRSEARKLMRLWRERKRGLGLEGLQVMAQNAVPDGRP